MQLTIQPGNIISGIFGANYSTEVQNITMIITGLDGYAVEADDVYVVITDSAGVNTVNTNIAHNTDTHTYTLENINIAGYPSGAISITWYALVDEDTYTQTISVDYTQPQTIAVGLNTYTSPQIHLNQPHNFSVVVANQSGNYLDGYAARLVVANKDALDLATISADTNITGQGIWQLTYTFTGPEYNTDIHQIRWQWQSANGADWVDVQNSKRIVEILPALSGVVSAGTQLATVLDIRQEFPMVDSFLDGLLLNKPERDLLLQGMLSGVSNELNQRFANTDVIANPLMKSWAVLQTIVDLISSVGANGAKYSSSNLQLTNWKQKLWRVKQVILGKHRTIRIGK